MKTPDPRGYPRCSAMARLDEAIREDERHWSFNPWLQTHKSVSIAGLIRRSPYSPKGKTVKSAAQRRMEILTNL